MEGAEKRLETSVIVTEVGRLPLLARVRGLRNCRYRITGDFIVAATHAKSKSKSASAKAKARH